MIIILLAFIADARDDMSKLRQRCVKPQGHARTRKRVLTNAAIRRNELVGRALKASCLHWTKLDYTTFGKAHSHRIPTCCGWHECHWCYRTEAAVRLLGHKEYVNIKKRSKKRLRQIEREQAQKKQAKREEEGDFMGYTPHGFEILPEDRYVQNLQGIKLEPFNWKSLKKSTTTTPLPIMSQDAEIKVLSPASVSGHRRRRTTTTTTTQTAPGVLFGVSLKGRTGMVEEKQVTTPTTTTFSFQ
eukprot:gnl/MRDRNA2_/MRDRNA2_182212_c0_seq1.p1 gnl/MRDRNA2_/MRDRNA2_182212_c0~~gnl/MRDRNA2_/MRDRNA2_182212_c0_seq1.p1  ORF type:complete len:243 (-),score=37.65 gnl/MRDRNA2_/MRDRNA2_182212_c0_seq1:638-1366(-)